MGAKRNPHSVDGQVCKICGAPATQVIGNRNFHCTKHYRFRQMRDNANTCRKTIPSMEELESLVPPGMMCVVCKRTMTWLAKEKGRSPVISLQHDRDGTHRLICYACNIRHAVLPGDLIYKLDLTRERYCHKCKSVKPLDSFARLIKGSPRKTTRLSSQCKACLNALKRDWISRNYERHVTKRRAAERRRYYAQKHQGSTP
jgi:bacterioferritin-associated ferredoxin